MEDDDQIYGGPGKMLTVLQTAVTLRLTSSGRLLPWLGPALRGLIGGRFKSQVCRHSPVEQETTWEYCTGCPHMAACPYGQTLEHRGRHAPGRPFVLDPHFPAPSHGTVGLRIPLRVMFIGHSAAQHVAAFFKAASDAGRDPSAGIGPDHATFEISRDPPPGVAAHHWWLVDLPVSLDALAGTVPRVKIQLSSPFFPRTRRGDGRRWLITEPSFADLFEGVSSLFETLYKQYDQPLQAEFAALKAAAHDVLLLESSYEMYRQPRHSNRTEERAVPRAIIGSAVYGNVPLALLKWLVWGGRLHVGTNRVAGAGGWRVAWTDRSQYRGEAGNSWHWLD